MERIASEADSLGISLNTESTGSHLRWRLAIQELARAPIQTLLLARRGWITGSGILAVVEDTPNASTIAALANRLAERSHSPLSVLIESQDGDEQSQIDRLEHITGQDTELPHSIQVVRTLDAEAILAAAGAARARLIVLPWRDPPRQADLYSQLLNHERSAILLVK